MSSFIIDITEILDVPGQSFDVTGELSVEDLTVGDEHFVLTAPASVEATITNAGSGIVATGSVSAPVTATCCRCLCDFPTVITGEIEAFFIQEGDEPGEDDEGTVSELGMVDLGPALLAALRVEAPFAPIHDEECAGLCAQCGADLNTETCDCPCGVDDDHPFAALGALVVDDADEEA